MQQLTRFEALRIQAIVEEAHDRFVLLEHITPDVTAQRDDLAEAEIAQIIEEQRSLQVEYESLLSQRQTLKLQTNKTKLQEVQKEIERVSKDLSSVTQALCRHIKENPNISENLKKIQRERSDLIALLTTALDELGHNSMRSLVAAVEAEKQQQDALLETVARQRDNAKMVDQLQKSLQEERTQRAKDKESRAAQIAELKERLGGLREDSIMRIRMLDKDTTAKLNATQRLQKQRISELEEEIRVVETKLAIENTVNQQTTQFLTKKNDKLGKQNSEWQEKLNLDVEKANSDLKNLRDKLADTIRRYEDLQKQFEEVTAFLEDERKAEEERQRQAAEALRRNKAAFEIQALWLGWRERKHAADEKKKKKVGKKGKKGKK